MTYRTARTIAIVVFIVMLALDGYQVWRIAFVRHEADFPAYLAAANGVLEGANPYAARATPPYNTLEGYRAFVYPLFIAVVWIPFTLVSALAASFLWFALSSFFLVASLYFIVKLIGIKDERHRLLLAAVLVLLFVSIIQAELMYGQINLFVLALVLFALDRTRESQTAAGISLGAAIAAKLMPVVVLPVLLLNRQRTAWVAIITTLVACILIPYLVMGERIIEYYQYWFNTVLTTGVTSSEQGHRSFDVARVIAQFGGSNVASTVLKLICGMVLLAFPIYLLVRHNRLTEALFLSLVLSPLTANLSEPYHLVIFMPAMGLLIADAIRSRNKWNWIAIVAIQLCILWGYGLAVPIDTIGMLVLFALVFKIALRKEVTS